MLLKIKVDFKIQSVFHCHINCFPVAALQSPAGKGIVILCLPYNSYDDDDINGDNFENSKIDHFCVLLLLFLFAQLFPFHFAQSFCVFI